MARRNTGFTIQVKTKVGALVVAILIALSTTLGTIPSLYRSVDNTDLVSHKTAALDLSKTQEVDQVAVPAKLIRVVDGDTLLVEIDGVKERVRLIGIDTPESVHPDHTRNTSQGKRASEYTTELLKDVQVVFLVQDVQDRDSYGRLLRYVWLDRSAHTDDIDDIATYMVNGILVHRGIAKAKVYKPNTAYTPYFKALAKG